MNVVVLPATKGARAPDAFTFLEGGPGEAATPDAAGLARELAGIREHRDILLVDQRGTGASHPLPCDLFQPAAELASFLREFIPAEAARRCRASLQETADLTQYTTAIAADDLDDVRAALGYETLDVMGASYGTRAALVYLRRHGDRVRSVILHGVSPVDQTMPLHFARDTQRALEGVLEECEAENPCRRALPDGRNALRRLVKRLADAPAEVEVTHPVTGEPATVRLSRDVAAETLRYLAYSSGGARFLPIFVHAASDGDLRPLAEMALFFRRNVVNSGFMGLYLAVTCAEDLPWVDPAEAAREAEGTALGDYRAREQRAACAAWPAAKVPAAYRSPVRSDKPVLIFSGALDPVTPPDNGARVARTLSKSLHVVVPRGGHSFDGLEGLDCVSRLRTEFIERASTEGLDTRCVADVRRPPFPTEVPAMKPVAVDAAALARLAGAFRSEDAKTSARVDVSGGRAVITVDGQEAARLVPVSPTRWRIVGSPLAYALFEIAGDRAARLTLEDWGHVDATLVRDDAAAAPRP